MLGFKAVPPGFSLRTRLWILRFAWRVFSWNSWIVWRKSTAWILGSLLDLFGCQLPIHQTGQFEGAVWSNGLQGKLKLMLDGVPSSTFFFFFHDAPPGTTVFWIRFIIIQSNWVNLLRSKTLPAIIKSIFYIQEDLNSRSHWKFAITITWIITAKCRNSNSCYKKGSCLKIIQFSLFGLESNNQGKSNEVKCGIYSNPKEMDNEKEKMVFTHVRFVSSHQKITVFFHFWWDGIWQRKGKGKIFKRI